MILVAELVEKEKQRIEYMILEYENRLNELPKGSITENHNGEKTYYYLKYREGKKVVSQYISHDDIENVQSGINERKHIESMIKALKDELKFANKALGVKV